MQRIFICNTMCTAERKVTSLLTKNFNQTLELLFYKFLWANVCCLKQIETSEKDELSHYQTSIFLLI